MNIWVSVSLQIRVFSRCIPRSGTTESCGNSAFEVFKGPPYRSSEGPRHMHSHQQGRRSSLFSTPSPAFITYRLFDDGHSDQCEVMHHCSFDLNLSSSCQHWASSHVLIGYLYVFFGGVSVLGFCQIFGGVVWFPIIESYELFMYLGNLSPVELQPSL